MTNKASGNLLEDRVANLLYKDGCFVIKLTQSIKGQPADLIACKGGKCYLIDCKDCKDNIFSSTRIEPNQFTSMELFANRGNGDGLFVLQMNDKQLYILSLYQILTWGKKSITQKDLESSDYDYTFKTWREDNLCR